MLSFTRRRRSNQFNPWYGLLILAVLTVAFGLQIIDGLRSDQPAPATVPSVAYQDLPEPVVISADNSPLDALAPAAAEVIEQPPVRPAEFNLAVPFTSQAPTGDWDPIHEDACEEAAMFMATEFYTRRLAGKIDPAIVDPELFSMIDVQTELGMGYSISVAEAATFIKKYYGLETVIIDNPTVDDIKDLIISGKPVIVPAAGQELGNPFFTGDGPLYHMYVIRGYTATTFITNDPGTRHGENYVYDIEVLMNSIGDWNGGDPAHGPQRIFYIVPPST